MPPTPITEIPVHPWLCLSRFPHCPKNRAPVNGAVVDKTTPVVAGVRLTTTTQHILQNAHAPIAPHLYLLQTAVPWVMVVVLMQQMRMGPRKA